MENRKIIIIKIKSRNTGTETKNKLLFPYKKSKEYLCIRYDIGWYLEILMYTSSPLAISCILSSVQTISMSHFLCNREWPLKLNTGKQKNSILGQYSLILQEHCTVLYFWLHHEACRILVPQAGIEPMPPSVGARTLSQWATKKVQQHVL